MKVEKQQQAREFKPFSINFSVETEEDAKALYAIFNKNGNSKLIGTALAEHIRYNLIGERFYVDSGVIANGIDYEDFYK